MSKLAEALAIDALARHAAGLNKLREEALAYEYGVPYYLQEDIARERKWLADALTECVRLAMEDINEEASAEG